MVDSLKFPQQDKIPRHVGIIMDGNGRWAKQKKLPRYFGHQEGLTALKNAVKFCVHNGIGYLTVYAFSTENWFRPVEEVNFLMKLMEKAFRDEIDELKSEGVRVRLVGDRSSLSAEACKLWEQAEESTQDNDRLQLNVAFNYGGRKEITQAARNLAQLVADGKLLPAEISEELIAEHLYTKGVPEPDLVIRTGGEYRISNFLLWQSAYSEWYVTSTLWPDFSEQDFADAISSFAQRDRRFGRI